MTHRVMAKASARVLVRALWVAGLLVLGETLAVEPAAAGMITVTANVAGTAQPWLYSPGGLNSNYQFGVNDGTAPTVLGAADGFSFAPGGSFTISYLSGTVSVGGSFGYYDANGDPSYPENGNTGSTGTYFPSRYFNPATYPANLGELVGTFTDISGAIVGTPFAIGDGPTTVVAPTGSAHLQLGINDDKFSDNQGSFRVSVTGLSAVPEPSTLALTVVGALISVIAWSRRRLA